MMDKSIAFMLVLVFLSTSCIFTLPLTKANSEIVIPKIGLYYYPWYVGDWSVNHKNCPDTPVLGQYNSSDLHVMDQHLNWFEQLGIDFIIFSWWGKGSPADANTKIMANEISRNYSNIQFFIMVEPFTTGWDEAYNPLNGICNYTLIYNYIYDTYADHYNSSYFYLDGKPAIGFYDGPTRNLTINGVPDDNRFTSRLIGPFPNDNWEYQVPDPSLSTQPVCMDNEISVCPRYDAHGWHEDVNYTQELYDQQWHKAISDANQGKVNIVTIISWNEYAERTQIEPTNDTTSAFKSDPFHLFNKTKQYIETIKTINNTVAPTSLTTIYTIAGGVVLTVIVLTAFVFRKKTRQKNQNWKEKEGFAGEISNLSESLNSRLPLSYWVYQDYLKANYL